MKILFIAPRMPLPADTGGKIRTFNILLQLAKKAKVHLVCFSFDENDQKFCPQLKDKGIEVTLVPGNEPGICKKIMQVLLSPLPVSVSKYYTGDMENILTELNETNRFDAVHIDHVHMAHYCKCFKGVPCVVDEHNVEYRILERCADVEKSLIKRAVFKNQARKMRRFEKESVSNMSAYCAVSQDDKDLLDQFKCNGSSGYVIPNGVDTEYFKTQDTGHRTQEETVVFTGSMDWFPNDDAALYFCKDILPIIWETKPNVKFIIVGKDPSAPLKACARSDERINCTGRVDDVRPYVIQSAVFVVPLRIGGGTRLKILEAMSMEKAVISTSIGAEGIDCQDDKNIILADRPLAFAQKVIALMDDPEKCSHLGTEGRKLVLEKYDWNIVGAKLNTIYEKLKAQK